MRPALSHPGTLCRLVLAAVAMAMTATVGLCLAPRAVGADAAAAGQSGAGLNATAVEALRRLKGVSLDSNSALKSTILKLIESARGTPEFVEFVRDFAVEGQEEALIDIAAKHPGDSLGADALRVVLGGKVASLRDALAEGPVARREALLSALANTGDTRAIPFLADAINSTDGSETARTEAARGLAQTEEGARKLLSLGPELKPEARVAAGLILSRSRWEDIRQRALEWVPVGSSGTALPPIDDLVARKGNPAAGARVFRNERAACAQCHRVGNEGIDYGPALSQIGAKLGKRALYESILQPSAGISFGFEGWVLETADGEELFGIIQSETDDEISLRQAGGIVTRVPKKEVVAREKQRLSVMPEGLAQSLSVEELREGAEEARLGGGR
jgi:putative heme-binding domain-containing protein